MISRGSLTHFPSMIITLRPSLVYVFFSFLSFLRSTLSFTSILSFLRFLSSATPTAPETRLTLTMMMAIRRGKIQETVPPLESSSSPTCVFLHTRLPSVDHSSTYPGTSACQQVVDDEDCKDEDKLWLQRCFCGFSLFILEVRLFV